MFFTKKTSQITDNLVESCLYSYNSLCKNIKELEGQDLQIGKNQSNEILTIPVSAIIIATNLAFDDRPKVKMEIIDDFYKKLLNKFFPDSSQRSEFNEHLDKRYREYKDILSTENSGSSMLLFGERFCQYLFGDCGATKLSLMYLIRSMYSVYLTNTKEFLDEMKLNL